MNNQRLTPFHETALSILKRISYELTDRTSAFILIGVHAGEVIGVLNMVKESKLPEEALDALISALNSYKAGLVPQIDYFSDQFSLLVSSAFNDTVEALNERKQ